jgi:hypothetical protein
MTPVKVEEEDSVSPLEQAERAMELLKGTTDKEA